MIFVLLSQDYVRAAVIHNYECNPGSITIDTVSDEQVFRFKGCVYPLNPGNPEIPVELINIAVPEGFTAVGVKVTDSEWIDLPQAKIPRPQPYPQPYSVSQLRPVKRNKSVYQSDAPYPDEPVKFLCEYRAGET